MKEKKILALDMDGTALNDEGILTSEVIESINLAKRNNCIVCFVTGRRDIDIAPIEEQCKSADYLLMNSGAKILDVKQKKVWFNKLIDCDTAKSLVAHCQENNILLYVTSGLFWAVNYMTEGVRHYAQILKSQPVIYSSCEDLPLDKIDGFMVNSSGAHVEEYIKQHRMPLYCMQSEPNCIDIVEGTTGKWKAVELLARELKVEHRNIIAVGNYSNDIDMIVNAGVGIAVANALQEVKEAAGYVTDADNNHNAVGEIVRKFVIGGSEICQNIYWG
jgi:5-amino-6-(5-phospho-D-ribitylamino)uracil phosphatase